MARDGSTACCGLIVMVIAGLYLLFSFLFVMWPPHLAFLVPEMAWHHDLPRRQEFARPGSVMAFSCARRDLRSLRSAGCEVAGAATTFRPMILCGQHSLEIFALGVLLSFVGHFCDA